MSVFWNPWHGCRKLSEGCLHCYVYRIDSTHGKAGDEIRLNADYLLPLRKNAAGEWKIPSGETVWTCFSSDFLLEDADEWRPDVWKMMKTRSDLRFVFFTKRILRLPSLLPPDWEDGYPNVTIGCTCENQARADERLPVFLSLPIAGRLVICEPLLGEIDLSRYLSSGEIREVSAGGESGDGARICDYAWVLGIREQCKRAGVRFSYHQTGALLRRDGVLYRIPRRLQQAQAKKANIDL